MKNFCCISPLYHHTPVTHTQMCQRFGKKNLESTYSHLVTQKILCQSSGPNNSVVLNKRVGWIFLFKVLSENACLRKIFKPYKAEFFGGNK